MSVNFSKPLGQWQRATPVAANCNADLDDKTLVLAIGFSEDSQTREILSLAANDVLVSVPSVSDLSVAMLTSLAPGRIMTALFSLENDVIVTAQWLQKAQYQGALCVVGPKLPRPVMVTREIQAMCPSVPVQLCIERASGTKGLCVQA